MTGLPSIAVKKSLSAGAERHTYNINSSSTVPDSSVAQSRAYSGYFKCLSATSQARKTLSHSTSLYSFRSPPRLLSKISSEKILSYSSGRPTSFDIPSKTSVLHLPPIQSDPSTVTVRKNCGTVAASKTLPKPLRNLSQPITSPVNANIQPIPICEISYHDMVQPHHPSSEKSNLSKMMKIPESKNEILRCTPPSNKIDSYYLSQATTVSDSFERNVLLKMVEEERVQDEHHNRRNARIDFPGSFKMAEQQSSKSLNQNSNNQLQRQSSVSVGNLSVLVIKPEFTDSHPEFNRKGLESTDRSGLLAATSFSDEESSSYTGFYSPTTALQNDSVVITGINCKKSNGHHIESAYAAEMLLENQQLLYARHKQAKYQQQKQRQQQQPSSPQTTSLSIDDRSVLDENLPLDSDRSSDILYLHHDSSLNLYVDSTTGRYYEINSLLP